MRGSRLHRDALRRVAFCLAAFVVFSLVALTAQPAAARYASIVVDADSGAVLHEVNADDLNYPASLTKMMTLYMAFEAVQKGKLRLDQRLPVSARAAGQAPSRLGLDAGETITVRDLILALVTKSANDAAAVLAEGMGGTESAFAEQMTARAWRLGMTSTTFRNASGLPNPGQRTTARDMMRLAVALYRDFPEQYRFFSTREFVYNGIVHENHNRLMNHYEGMDGIKTGYIRASGFNLVASAHRGERRLIGVVMGGRSARDRDSHMASLLDDAFAGRRDTTTTVASAETAADGFASRAARGLSLINPVGRAEAAPTVANPARRSEGQYAIQVGAYSKQAGAEKAAALAVAKLPDIKSKPVQIVAPRRGDKERVYRARLNGFTKDEANDACRDLRAKKIQCAVVAR